jgi:hypothetical protein
MSGYLKISPQDLCATLGHCYFPPNTSELVAELHNQTLFVASDGSVLNNGATHAWILYGVQSKICAYGHGPVPGGGQPLTSLWAEVGGFVGGMLALDALLSTAGEPISAYCCIGALIDNMALISHIQTWHHHGSGGTLAPEYNLLQVAKGIMAKHKLLVEPEHIKSHQDNDTEYSNLPWKAQLNCDCDQLAGSTCTCPQCLETSPTLYILPTGHIASLEIDGTFITAHTASAIKETSL